MEIPFDLKNVSLLQNITIAKFEMIRAYLRACGVMEPEAEILRDRGNNLPHSISFTLNGRDCKFSWAIIEWMDVDSGPSVYVGLAFRNDAIYVDYNSNGSGSWSASLFYDIPAYAEHSPVTQIAERLGIDPHTDEEQFMPEGEALARAKMMATIFLTEHA